MNISYYISAIFDGVNNGFKSEALDVFSIVAILFAIAVITLKNPISTLLCLIGLFGSVAVYLIFIGLNFIGFSYLIVYIGAVSILFLFVLMLLNIRTSELLNNNNNSIPLAFLIIILINYTWIQISPEYTSMLNNTDNTWLSTMYDNLLTSASSFWITVYNKFYVMFPTSNNWDNSMVETGHIVNIGMIMYTSHNIWLLLSGLILLLAMAGCIVILV